MTKAELLDLLKNIDDSTKICIWADNTLDNAIRDPGGTYDILENYAFFPHNNSVAFEMSKERDEHPIFKALKSSFDEFLRHLAIGGNYIDIHCNYALISIERVPSSALDRGNFLVRADHRLQFVDKCYIDESDRFPRYYFSLHTMLSEIGAFMGKRNLEIEDIRLECVSYE
jgi:hypothetical protein